MRNHVVLAQDFLWLALGFSVPLCALTYYLRSFLSPPKRREEKPLLLRNKDLRFALCQFAAQYLLQCPFGAFVAMHNADGAWRFPHASDKPYQPLLVGMSGVASQVVHAGLDGVGFSVQGHGAALSLPLYLSPRCAFALVADKQHIMPGVEPEVTFLIVVTRCSLSPGLMRSGL